MSCNDIGSVLSYNSNNLTVNADGTTINGIAVCNSSLNSRSLVIQNSTSSTNPMRILSDTGSLLYSINNTGDISSLSSLARYNNAAKIINIDKTNGIAIFNQLSSPKTAGIDINGNVQASTLSIVDSTQSTKASFNTSLTFNTSK